MRAGIRLCCAGWAGRHTRGLFGALRQRPTSRSFTWTGTTDSDDEEISWTPCQQLLLENMAYENNEMKFVTVVNRKHSLASILNPLAHTAFGLSGKGVNPEQLLDYSNSASCFLAKIDLYLFIILHAQNRK